MSDWSVGDLAVCIHDGHCTHCGAPAGVEKGRLYRVSGVNLNPHRVTLSLEGVPDITAPDHHPGHVVGRFRKIRPDEHEGCEPEFVTLLKRIRQPQLARENARG